MADKKITPVVLGRSVGTTNITAGAFKSSEWVTLTSADNGYIDENDTAVSGGIFLPKVVLLVKTDTGTTAPGIKFLSSTEEPYSGSGIPDLTVAIPVDAALSTVGTSGTVEQGGFAAIPLGETARFKDTDGRINFVRSTGDTGAADYGVHAIVLP